MPKEKKADKPAITIEEPKAFSKDVMFLFPFEGSVQFGGGKQYIFKITSRDIWKQGKRGPKTAVRQTIDNEAVYDWLVKYEQVISA